MHPPGLEPGSPPWKGGILPLDHECNTLHTSPSITLMIGISIIIMTLLHDFDVSLSIYVYTWGMTIHHGT